MKSDIEWVDVEDGLPSGTGREHMEFVDCLVTVVESRWPHSPYDFIDSPEERTLVMPASFDVEQKIWDVGGVHLNALIPMEEAPLDGWYVVGWALMPAAMEWPKK